MMFLSSIKNLRFSNFSNLLPFVEQESRSAEKANTIMVFIFIVFYFFLGGTINFVEFYAIKQDVIIKTIFIRINVRILSLFNRKLLIEGACGQIPTDTKKAWNAYWHPRYLV